MLLAPGEWRIEHADQMQILIVMSAQEVSVMLIKHVDRPRFDFESDLAVCRNDLAAAAYAIAGFQMAPVLEA